MKIWITLCIFIFVSTSYAQKIKVRQVKGNKAIVESIGNNLQPGQTYDLISPEEFGGDTTTNTRKYVVGISSALANTKSDAKDSVNETYFNLEARFGWNLGTFEWGPLVSYSSAITDVNVYTYKVGAFVDYNFIANIPGEAFLYGLTANLSYGQHDTGTADALPDYKYDFFEVFVGPVVKWFPSGGSYGFRIDGGYLYQRQSTSGLGNPTVSGFASNLGIFGYF